MNKFKFGAIILFILFVLSSPVFAWELNGNVITINTNEAQEIDRVTIEGDVYIESANIKLKGDYGLYYPRKEEITIKENIEVVNDSYNLKGEQLQGNLGTQRFLISGQVKVTGPDLLLSAKKIDLDNTTGIMVLEGDPYFEYKELSASADIITYYREKKKAELEGNVVGKRSGQEFTATNLTINIAEEQIKLSGKAKLIFSDNGGDN